MASWFDQFRKGLAGLMIEFLVIQVESLLAVARHDKSEFNTILTRSILALGLDCPTTASFPEVFKATTRWRKKGAWSRSPLGGRASLVAARERAHYFS